MARRNSFNDVTRNWKDDRKATSNVERAKFHYFNPNGLYHRKKRMDETINHWVDAGYIPSGWVIARSV